MRKVLRGLVLAFAIAAPAGAIAEDMIAAPDDVSVRCWRHCSAQHPWDGGARMVCQHECYFNGGPG